jgi:hypothetical protein
VFAADAGFDPVKAFRKELGIQSNRLDQDLKERVERAIAALGYRVTVGDVAARAGVKVSEADEALKALAYDSLGALEVGLGISSENQGQRLVAGGHMPDMYWHL